MNNKTIIEFSLRRIPELFRPRSMLSASAFGISLNNSGYPAQPHPIIVIIIYLRNSWFLIG
jgi:hypothetical protein